MYMTLISVHNRLLWPLFNCQISASISWCVAMWVRRWWFGEPRS